MGFICCGTDPLYALGLDVPDSRAEIARQIMTPGAAALVSVGLTDTQQDVLNRATASLEAKARAFETELGSPVTAARFFAILDQHFQMAAKLDEAAKTLSSNYDREKHDIATAFIETGELRSIARLLLNEPAKVKAWITAPVQPSNVYAQRARVAVPGIYRRQANMLRRAVTNQDQLLNLPAVFMEWTGEQLQRGFSGLTGLPEWLFPVAVVAAGVVVVKVALAH